MSIRYKIFLILLALTLSIQFIISAAYYIYSQDYIKKEALSNLESLANIQHQRLETFINNNIEKLKLINSRTQLRRSLKKYNQIKESESLKLMQKIIADAMRGTKRIDDIFIIDLNGKVLLNSNNLADNRSLQKDKIFLRGKDGFSASYLIDKKDMYSTKIIFSAPLKLDEELLGVIAMTVNMDYMNEYMKDYTGLGMTGEVLMGLEFNKDEILLFTPLRFKEYPLVVKKESNIAIPMNFALKKKETVMSDVLDYRSEEVIAVTRYLDSLGFGIVVKMDQKEIFETSYNLKILLFELFLALIIVVIFGSVIFSRLITKPVLDIIQTAVLISHGDFKKRVHSLTEDELGELSNAVNNMADKLINTNIILEEKVKEKTQELQEKNKELEKLSQTDALTGVANRAKFDEHLKVSWRRSLRYKKQISLLIIDIDHFKAVNDTYGHQTGDNYLKKVAASIHDLVSRVDDLPARYGGEEFALILEDTKTDGAVTVAEKLRQNIFGLKLENKFSKTEPFVTVSIGIASVLPAKEISIEDFIKQADEALYKAKDNGRNRVEVYEK